MGLGAGLLVLPLPTGSSTSLVEGSTGGTAVSAARSTPTAKISLPELARSTELKLSVDTRSGTALRCMPCCGGCPGPNRPLLLEPLHVQGHAVMSSVQDHSNPAAKSTWLHNPPTVHIHTEIRAPRKAACRLHHCSPAHDCRGGVVQHAARRVRAGADVGKEPPSRHRGRHTAVPKCAACA